MKKNISPSENNIATISLNGEWKFYKPSEDTLDPLNRLHEMNQWETMPIPSNWFLRSSKTYPGDGQGFDYSGTLWFARKFDVPEKFEGKIIRLEFNMVDYFADVFLNGQFVGSHSGCFQNFDFDISDKVHYGQENILLVRVNSPKSIHDPSGDLAKGWPKRQYLVKGIFGYHDTRPGGTSDRGQDCNTGGIIGDVYLKITRAIHIGLVRITPTLSKDHETAELKIEAMIVNHLSKDIEVNFEYEITPANFKDSSTQKGTHTFVLRPGRNEKLIYVTLSNPKLWWSWDYGYPHLYFFNSKVSLKDQPLDKQQTRFGIRTFRKEDGWKCFLNDQLIFQRGSNYISTQWLSEMDKAKYLKDVQMMKDANLNSIRVHAHVEKQEFYDACDELGIMVWQDFALQWGYTDDEEFRKDALRQIEDMVNQFYNHPSIIIWCSHNESPWAMGWMEKSDIDQNKNLDNALTEKVRMIDPTRYAHNSSGAGDGHPYCGWYGDSAKKFRELIDAPFITEYGAQALPSLENLKKIFGDPVPLPQKEEDWALWKYHNMQPDLTFGPGRVQMGKTIEDFIESSQKYQAKVIKFGTECYRRAKGKMHGMYHFMFVEDWPSITWAVVDYDRIPKLGYYALQTSMQPLLPSIDYDADGNFSLWIVNDFYQKFDHVSLKWELMDSKGNSLKKGENKLTIQPNSSEKIVDLGNLKNLVEQNGKIKVWIEDAKGKTLAQNSFERWEWVDEPVIVHLKEPFAKVSASTEHTVNMAMLAVDGDRRTRWESVQKQDPQWIMFELKEIRSIQKIKIAWEQASAKVYTVELSEDGNRWKTVSSISDGLPGEERTISIEPTPAKFIRINCTQRTTEWGYSIWEMDLE